MIAAMTDPALPDAIVAIVRRGARVLMIRRGATVPDAGVWAPPSGKMEVDESQADAVIREVREEIGLAVRPLRKIWESVSFGRTHRLHWWLADADDGPLALDPREVAEVRWVTARDIEALAPTFPTDRHFFAHVLEDAIR